MPENVSDEPILIDKSSFVGYYIPMKKSEDAWDGRRRPGVVISGGMEHERRAAAAALRTYFSIAAEEDEKPDAVLHVIFSDVDRAGAAPPPLRLPCGIYIGFRAAPAGGHPVHAVFLSRPVELRRLTGCALELAAASRGEVNGVRETAERDYTFDSNTLTVSFGGMSVRLTKTEFALFSLLHSRMGETVPASELTDCLWKGKTDSACAVYVCYLRKKLESVAGANALTSVRGKGYMLSRPG